MTHALAVVVLLASAAAAAPIPDAKAFKLRWYGQSFFQLETPAGKRVVFDPHAMPEFGRPAVAADVILCSHRHNDHAQPEVVEGFQSARVFHGLKEPKGNRPPDWNPTDEKVGQIRVRAVPTYHDAESGMKRGKNAAWVVEAEGLTVCHLGDLGHELSPAQVKAIGPVDVLLVPVGGIYTLNGTQAKAVAGQIKPRRFVLPMHYGVPGYDDLLAADEFLEGQPNVKRTPATNELVIPAQAKEGEPPAVVVPGWKTDDAAKK